MAQSHKSALRGSTQWPKTPSLLLSTSTVYDLTLWLGLWRYWHHFTWVILHQADLSLPGHSWAQALRYSERGSGERVVFLPLGGFLRWEPPGPASAGPLLLFTVRGALWHARNDTVALILQLHPPFL